MPAKFVFCIRPLSIEEGFELDCQGLLRTPVRRERLVGALLVAAQLGRDLEAEIQILDCTGAVAEVLPLAFADVLTH
jgi:hypothetical protein